MVQEIIMPMSQGTMTVKQQRCKTMELFLLTMWILCGPCRLSWYLVAPVSDVLAHGENQPALGTQIDSW